MGREETIGPRGTVSEQAHQQWLLCPGGQGRPQGAFRSHPPQRRPGVAVAGADQEPGNLTTELKMT